MMLGLSVNIHAQVKLQPRFGGFICGRFLLLLFTLLDGEHGLFMSLLIHLRKLFAIIIMHNHCNTLYNPDYECMFRLHCYW